jgi:hypothetical protein
MYFSVWFWSLGPNQIAFIVDIIKSLPCLEVIYTNNSLLWVNQKGTTTSVFIYIRSGTVEINGRLSRCAVSCCADVAFESGHEKRHKLQSVVIPKIRRWALLKSSEVYQFVDERKWEWMIALWRSASTFPVLTFEFIFFGVYDSVW